jgi:hypothetical protein
MKNAKTVEMIYERSKMNIVVMELVNSGKSLSMSFGEMLRFLNT